MILPPTLETGRLTIRAPRMTDLEPYAAMMVSERAHFTGGPFRMENTPDIFNAEVAGWILHGFGTLTIEERASGTFAGVILLQQPAHYPEREIGWDLTAEYEGRGIAHEAAQAVLRYLFETRGWGTVVSYIDDDNERSIVLAERLGATRDAAAAKPGDSRGTLVYRHLPGAFIHPASRENGTVRMA